MCKCVITHKSRISPADLRQTENARPILTVLPAWNVARGQAHFPFLARIFGEVWGVDFWGAQSTLVGKCRHLDLKVEGSRPDSTWLKRDTRTRSPSFWFPPIGPQNFPHLSSTEALIPRAPSQGCLRSRDPCPTMGRPLCPFPLGCQDLKQEPSAGGSFLLSLSP